MIDFTKVDDKVYYAVKYLIIAALLILAFFIVRGYFIQKWDREEIIENKGFTNGKIIYYGHSSISYHTVKFTYNVEGNHYENQHGIELLPCASITDFSGCIGLEYWVIYSKLNPEKSYLLASSNEYEMFNLKVPVDMK